MGVAAQTMGVLRRHPGPLILLGVLFAGLPTVMEDVAAQWAPLVRLAALDPYDSQVAASMEGAVFRSLLLAGVVHLVAADAAGHPARFAASLATALRCFLPVLGLSLAVSIGITLGAVLAVVPGVLLAVRWFVAIPAGWWKGPGLSRALARSAGLMRGRRWRALGWMVAYGVAARPARRSWRCWTGRPGTPRPRPRSRWTPCWRRGWAWFRRSSWHWCMGRRYGQARHRHGQPGPEALPNTSPGPR